MAQGPPNKPQRQDWRLSGREDPAAAEHYRAQVRSLFEVELHQPASEFHNRLEACNLEAMVFGRCTGVAQTFARTRAHARQDGIDHVQVILDLAGEWRGDYDGRLIDSGMGTLRIVDMSRPFECWTGDFQTLNLMMPRAALGTAAAADLHGLVLGEGQPGARLLSTLLNGLWATLDEISVEEGVAATKAVAVLLAGLVGQHGRPAAALRPISGVILAVAQNLVDSRLTDPSLTPEALCRHLGLSRSVLYGLFEKTGGVRAFIQGRKLDCAFEALARGAGGRTIAEVAFACGFRSAPHFTRAFRSRFGMNPTELIRLCEVGSEPPPSAFEGVAAVIDWFGRIARR